MLFEVRANAKRKAKVLFAQILCGLCIVGIFCFLRLDFMADYFKTDPFAYGLFVSFMAVFILLFVVTCYCGVRPRICVDEQTVTFYPLFRRAKEVAWGDITARKVEADSSYEQLRSTALGMLGATIPYLIYRKAHGLDEPGAVQTCPRRYAYYQGNKKLICILEREMENAERFDQMVCERLDAINLQKEGEGGFSATEVPAKRGGLAAVVLGLTALCAAGVVLFVVMPKMQSVPVSVEPPAAAEKVLYTCEDITFEIDPAWSEIDGYEGSFVDDATGIVYQLNGVSELFPYGAEEFYTELLTYYEENHDPVIGEPLEQSDTADGKERYLANILQGEIAGKAHDDIILLGVCEHNQLADLFPLLLDEKRGAGIVRLYLHQQFMLFADHGVEVRFHLLLDLLLFGSQDLQIIDFSFQIPQIQTSCPHIIRHHLEHGLGNIYRCDIILIGILLEQPVLCKAQRAAQEKQYQ